MDDELLRRTFYTRATRTLSIAHEVLVDLNRDNYDEKAALDALTRLDLEVSGWQSEIDAIRTYNKAFMMADASHAAWRHTGSIGKEPELPYWPSIVPPDDSAEMAVYSISCLRFNCSMLRGAITRDLSEDDFADRIDDLAKQIGDLGERLDEIKLLIDKEAVDEPDSDWQQDRSKLKEKQLEALEIIEADGPILGKNLATRLKLRLSTIRSHTIPALKAFGVKNKGDGYYIAQG